MTSEERQEAIQRLCQRLIDAGAARNQNELAQLLGVNRSNLSSALNGSKRALTESFVIRAQRAAAPYLEGPTTVNGNGNAVNHSHISAPEGLAQALQALNTQQELTKEAMAQNSRLLGIIEGLTTK